ncbi:hypothetical protein ACFQL4_02840 [Halosimplex aquaticum]
MNPHALLDVAALRLSGFLYRDRKLFARSVDAPPLVDVAAEAEATVDDVAVAGRHDIAVDTPVGTFDAAYMPWQWLGPEYPTVVYHHGSSEQPFDFGRFSSNTFRRLFVATNAEVPANVVAIRTPFHGGPREDYVDAMSDLANFVGMVASSTALMEAIRAGATDRTDGPVILSGTSLGGFAATLHRAVYGTADRYVPLLAGAAFGELFVSSVYRHVAAESALHDRASSGTCSTTMRSSGQ